MMANKKKLDSGTITAFAAGIAAAVLTPVILKSKHTRKAAVNVMAKGIGLQENAMSGFEKIREDAQDTYHEAKAKAKAEE
jgi:hypothetical protein